MKFEEQFPELKGRIWEIGEYHPEQRVGLTSIQDCCLSKQRARETIKRFTKKYSGIPVCVNLSHDLLKELGL